MKPNNFKKVIFLFGPTAVGKTDLLCSFFSHGYEVVNADSVQVYRHLDIGSAKADKSTLDTIPHHLIDILDPWETYNVSDFISLSDKACEEIRSRGNIPVISGGTAYYFKNYFYGLSEAPKSDPKIRDEVALWIKQNSLLKAHQYLAEIDPVSAKRINPNDSYRISRAIEVFKTCGKPLSSFLVPTEPRDGIDALVIGLTRDKEELKERIRKRVDIMFNQGLVEEVKKLIGIGANANWQGMQGIGYSEFLEELEVNPDFDSLNLDRIKEKIVMDSIHYAKRQMTFFKSFKDVHWVNPDNRSEIKKLVDCFVQGAEPAFGTES